MTFFILNKLGDALEVPVVLSKRAKRITIKITGLGVQLVLPFKAEKNTAYNFLQNKEQWIRNKLQKNCSFADIQEGYIPILDDIYKINIILSNKPLVKTEENNVLIYARSEQHFEVLKIYLKNKLWEEIQRQAQFFAEKYGLDYKGIRITESKCKWGSCSSKKYLTFNWRLIFAPRRIIQYLIAHEMAHLKEMNHSSRFWNLVEEIYPNYKDAKSWLKENGHSLHRFFNR